MVKVRKKIAGLLTRMASMRFALNLLISLGIITALGTLIPQGQDPFFYQELYGNKIGALMVALSMHKFYQAWWFHLLVAILCITIIVCAYRRLRKATNLKRIGSLILHLALVLILIGAAWSLGYAEKAGVEIAVGEKTFLPIASFSDAELKLIDFDISYYPDFAPRQYTSTLRLTEAEGEMHQQTIYVNHPLRVGNLKIYQSSWGWTMDLRETSQETPTELKIKDHSPYPLTDTGTTLLNAVFIPDYHEEMGRIASRSPLPNNPRLALSLYENGQLVDLTLMTPEQTAELGGYRFVFEDFTHYSGLQIKYDPGVNLVFFGFILLLCGLLARYGPLIFTKKRG